MGEHFNWVNVDKKEYLCPSDFGLRNKQLESVFCGNRLIAALYTLLADEWNGDHILFLGDECPVPDHPDREALRILNCDTKKHHAGHYYDTIVETYRNVSGLFCDAETEVRQEIQYYLDYLHDYNSGKRTEFPANEYGIDSDRPFDGLFAKKGMNFPYIINYTKKAYYSFALTRILQKDRSESIYSDPLPLLLEYGRRENCGVWVGDSIGASSTIPSEYTLIKEIVLDW